MEDDFCVRLEVLALRILTIELHKLLPAVRLAIILSQWHEVNRLWGECAVSEWGLESIEVMGADGNVCPLPTNILMKFILKIDEAFVSFVVEFDAAEDGTDNIRTKWCC